jgi:putative transposase
MRIRLARKYESFVSKKSDWMHKITRSLANEYDAIILENLNIEGMKKFNKGFAKTVTLDFSWSEFTTVLEYKMKYKGGTLIKVDRFFPSSKMCSKCGHIYKELKLDEREWTCKKCNSILHRDINASINLKNEGVKILQSNGITVPYGLREVTLVEIV